MILSSSQEWALRLLRWPHLDKWALMPSPLVLYHLGLDSEGVKLGT